MHWEKHTFYVPGSDWVPQTAGGLFWTGKEEQPESTQYVEAHVTSLVHIILDHPGNEKWINHHHIIVCVCLLWVYHFIDLEYIVKMNHSKACFYA